MVDTFLPTRAIFCSDENSDYIFCWPLVAQLWRVHHKITPTLFFVGSETAFQALSREHGEVVHFEVLLNIPTSFQAQVLRLLAPAMYPDDICVISDIDLLLLKTNFFARYGLGADKTYPVNSFFSLNRYSRDVKHMSLTYQIARGSTFAEVFGVPVRDSAAIRAKLTQWGGGGSGGNNNNPSGGIPWSRDEILLTQHLQRWNRTRGVWRQITTPGLWGRNGQHLTVTRFNGCRLPTNLANIVEYEPFHPLSSTLELAEKVIRAALPEFQFPAPEVIRGWYAGIAVAHHLSRHPEKRNQVVSNNPRVRPRPRLQVKNLAAATTATRSTALSKTSRPRLSMLRRRQ